MDEQKTNRDEQLGGLAGLGAGVIAGAELGTVMLPIPIVGTFVGGLMGGVVGSAVGRRVGGMALSGLNAFFDTLAGHPPEQGPPPSGGANP